MTMQRVPTAEIHPQELYGDAIAVTPVARDWGDDFNPNPDPDSGWTYYEAIRLDDGRVTDGDGYIACSTADDDQAIEDRRTGPMMNYAYPLPGYRGDPDQDAREIVDLPLCIVRDAGEDADYLALTGGGMDLSWEIAEAYMRLGYLPPAHFANLPGMAGRGTSDEDQAILRACRRSLEIAWERAERAHRALSDRFEIKEPVR